MTNTTLRQPTAPTQRGTHRTHEFEPTGQSISNWVAQADRDTGRRTDGLTTTARAKLTQLRRENRQLKLEREILSKAAAWFAQETAPNTKRSSGS